MDNIIWALSKQQIHKMYGLSGTASIEIVILPERARTLWRTFEARCNPAWAKSLVARLDLLGNLTLHVYVQSQAVNGCKGVAYVAKFCRFSEGCS